MTEITLKRIAGYKFEARNASGKTAILDGPAKIGGGEDGLRPMELLLIGLAGCSSFDILHMLHKGKQDVADMDVSVRGERADAIPAVFTGIHVHFKVWGNISPKRLEQAVQSSMEKYCSVAAMLGKTAKITHSHELLAAST